MTVTHWLQRYGEQRDNRRWWKWQEDRVYQLVVGLLPLQHTFPIPGSDVVNQAISIVLDIERRKADGQRFVTGKDHHAQNPDHAP